MNNNTSETLELDNRLLHEASKMDLVLANGQCGACERKGFPLFLVRKSVVPATFKSEINWEKGMLSLEGREPKTKFKTHKYVYRTLREGYVYLLCNRIGNNDSKNLDIMAYEVTYSGAFRLKEFSNIKGSRPKELPTSCIHDYHQLKAQFITIDNRVYDKVWIAYAAQRWEKDTLDYYREHSAERALRFSEVDLTQQEVGDISPQGRSFKFDDFFDHTRYLLELECDNKTVLDYFTDDQSSRGDNSTDIPEYLRAIRQGSYANIVESVKNWVKDAFAETFKQVIYTASHFNSLCEHAKKEVLKNTAKRYQSSQHYGVKNVAALVIEDSLGIAEELSIFRRQSLSPVIEGLAESDPKTENEVSRYTKQIHRQTHTSIYQSEKMRTISPLVEAMQTDKGREKFADYYQTQTNQVKNLPLSYFAAENRYAGKHYQHIEGYKSLIKSQLSGNIDDEAVLFLFYDSSMSLSNSNPFVQSEFERSHNYYSGKRVTYAELQDIDKICVLDCVGEETLAEQFGYLDESLLTKSHSIPYSYCKHLSTIGFETHSHLSPKNTPLGNYKELEISTKQQKQLLALYHTQPTTTKSKANKVDAVKVVHFYNLKPAKEALENKVLSNEWDKKYKKRLHQPTIEAYEQFSQQGYQSLFDHISELSQDYYHYLIWLFGEKADYYQVEDGCNKVIIPSEYNGLAFWRIECAPNSSDRHLNYLTSLLTIFDSDSLGNFTLPLHAVLWAHLFENKQSVYFHFLGDIELDKAFNQKHQYSLWNILTGRIDINNPEIISATVTQSNGDGTGFNVDVKKTFDYAVEFGNITSNNIKLQTLLIEKWVWGSLDGVNRAIENNIRIDHLLSKNHFMEMVRVFNPNGVRVKQYQLTMTVAGLQQYLKKMHQFSPVFFHENTMKTHQGTTIPMQQNQHGRWHTSAAGNSKIKSETVTVSMMLAFDNDEMQSQFESGLARHSHGAQSLPDSMLRRVQSNIIEVSDVTLSDQDVDRLAEIAKGKNRIEVIDNTVSGVLGGVGLFLTFMELRSLSEKLDSVTNQQIRDMLQRKIYKTYMNIAISSVTLIVDGLKVASYKSSSVILFFEKNPSLYKVFGNSAKYIGNIAKTIGFLDSLLEVGRAFKSFRAGNTGADVFMATSMLSLIISGAGILFAIPLWGQVALLFVGIGLAIMTAIYYDDGTEWNELDKWFNRCMLGNFDHKNLYPPYYLPTPACMALAEQDYYLVVNGGSSEIMHEKDWNLLSEHQYDLYLTLNLPDFVKEESWFEGRVAITQLSTGNSMELELKHGVDRLIVNPVNNQAQLSAFSLADAKDYDKRKEFYQPRNVPNAEITEDEELWQKLTNNLITAEILDGTIAEPESISHEKEATEIGLFEIYQRLGRIEGDYQVNGYIHYWPNGSTDNEGKALTPYLFSLDYRSDGKNNENTI